MISCGNKDFNAFSNIGIERITTVYGKAGTGKTCFCMMSAVENAKNGKKVLFIDTENGFSVDRLKQMAKDEFEKVNDNLILIKVKNFREQHDRISQIEKLTKNVSLVIIDKISNYYRTFMKLDKELALNMLNVQMKKLQELNSKGIDVLITNQVFSNSKLNKLEMVGYGVIFPYSKKVIEFTNSNDRIAYLRKPGLTQFRFKITDEGITTG